MSADHTAGLERVVHELEIGLLEEGFGWPLWVAAVGDDDVEFAAAVAQEGEAVADIDGGFGVGEAGGHFGEVLL